MKNKGFTLIELVVVIVILGILAVTAAPRFLNLQSDSRTASIEGLKGALEASIGAAYGKLAIDGFENKPDVWTGDKRFASVKEWCQDCMFAYGYPTGFTYTWENIVKGVKYGPDATDFRVGGDPKGKGDELVFSFAKNFDDNQWLTVDNCYVRYTPPVPSKGIMDYKLEVVPCN